IPALGFLPGFPDIEFVVNNQTGEASQTSAEGYLNEVLHWEVEHTAPPPQIPPSRICASWNAAYLDEGFGEVGGSGTAPSEPKQYPASFAEFALTAEGALGWIPPSQPLVGFLDAEGCVPQMIDGSVLTHIAGVSPG